MRSSRARRPAELPALASGLAWQRALLAGFALLKKTSDKKENHQSHEGEIGEPAHLKLLNLIAAVSRDRR